MIHKLKLIPPSEDPIQSVDCFLSDIVLAKLDVTLSTDNGQQRAENDERIIHEKFGEILQESASNLSDLISLHYLKVK